MKKILIGSLSMLLLAGGVAFASPAMAADDVCTPSAAWVEHIDHPAVGEPTITIDNSDYVPAWDETVIDVPASDAIGMPTIMVPNPDYVPAVEEQSHIVHHEAITHVEHHDAVITHHEAVTHTEWKYSLHGSQGETWLTSNVYKYRWTNGVDSDNKPSFWEQLSGIGFYERTSKTKVVIDTEAWDEVISEAWDETVIDHPAWDEVVIDVPASDAIGEPMIEVANPDYIPAVEEVSHVVHHEAVGTPTIMIDNPDYQEAWVQDINHDAVTCPTPAVVKPVTQVKKPVQKPAHDELAETGGGSVSPIVPIGGALAVALGSLGVVLGMRARRQH